MGNKRLAIDIYEVEGKDSIIIEAPNGSTLITKEMLDDDPALTHSFKIAIKYARIKYLMDKET